MEDLLYWIIEYVKVLLGYGFIMFIWPSVVFRKYLKGKSVTFRFGFCATVPIVLINTVVIMLGLLHILNRWTMWIFFYGLFVWSLREKFTITENVRKKFKYLIMGTFGWKHLLLLTWERILRFLKRVFRVFWKFYKVHWLEYTLLVMTVVYGMIYFSWGSIQAHSYGFSDMYVHHSWIYQLTQGKPFSAGIYPEGMHCLIYSLYALFGIRTMDGLLFLSGANVATVIVALYCLMKEIFGWRYSPIFALTIFLTLDVTGKYIMIGMSRMQCSLPQEIGFPAAFLCTLFLIRYLKHGQHFIKDGKISKGYWDENLFVFIMALAATIIIHFYATIMAFFLCVGVAVCGLRKIFTKKRFLPLVAGALAGVLIAAAPMVIGYATGIPLQGSLGWGLNVIKGSSSTNTTETNMDETVDSSVDVNVSDISIQEENLSNVPEKENTIIGESGGISQVPIENQLPAVEQKKVGLGERILQKLKEYGEILYEKSYVATYGKDFSSKLILICVSGVALCVFYKIVILFLRKVLHKNVGKDEIFDTYPMIIMASFVYMIFFTPREFGLPMLVEKSRLGFISHMLVVTICVMPLDLLYTFISKIGIKKVMHFVSLATVFGIVTYIYTSGKYHSYLYFELTRFNATVNVTNEIIECLPENSYTILSPTEELYQVIDYGRHEELLTFLQNQYRDSYTIPTEYVFIYLEKKPFQYAQTHFWKGPEWLATENYKKTYRRCSTHPEYLTSEISEEEAEKAIMYYTKLSDSYTNLTSRTILESKLQAWCEKFQELYPNELKTYYEDEYFVCYYFKQNPQKLYNLVIE